MNGMYAEAPPLALVRLYQVVRKIRRVIDMKSDNLDENRLTEAEYISCGGMVGKKRRRDGEMGEMTYSLKRQCAYAERSLRALIQGEMSMFDEKSRTPGKNQINSMFQSCRDLLEDTNSFDAKWYDTDDEEVDDYDGDPDAEDDEEEEEEEGKEEKEADKEEDEADEEEEADKEEDKADKEEDEDDDHEEDESEEDESEEDESGGDDE